MVVSAGKKNIFDKLVLWTLLSLFDATAITQEQYASSYTLISSNAGPFSKRVR